jgi:hypothetical protein
MLKYLIYILIVLLSSFPVYAAPSVSGVAGTVAQGNTIVISGSSFSAKASAAPIRWEDNESYTATNDVSSESGGYWVDESAAHIVVSSTQNRHGNSDREWESAIKYDQENQDGGSEWPTIYKDDIGFAATGKILISYWVYWETPIVAESWGAEATWQVKGIRTPDNVPTSYPDFVIYDWITNSPFSTATNAGNHGDPGESFYFATDIFQYEKWHNRVIVADMGTQDTADCDWDMYHSYADFSAAYDTDGYQNSSCWPAGGENEAMNAVTFHEYITSIETTNQVVEITRYYDDIYIDNVWNRVEIGDNATYASCTHREILIPSAWDAEEITATVNTGSFSSGTAYLFVIDSDNAPSTGYEIIIGSTLGAGSNSIGTGSNSIGVP